MSIPGGVHPCRASTLVQGTIKACACRNFVTNRHAVAYCECNHSCDQHGIKAKDILPGPTQ